MIRKELTLEANYVKNWGITEGIREFISNAFDAQVECNAVAEIIHKPESNKLIISTKGATISREVLLFGHSTKTERSDLIGHFGEGLKLGSLACVRGGFPVTIRTGSEVWKPVITRSKTYNADVLAVEISTGHKDVCRVSIEIENINTKLWLSIKEQFLVLCDVKFDEKIIVPYYGSILLSSRFKGNIYVKGILVEKKNDLAYGYDFMNIQTDRDRKMVYSWEFDYSSRQIWISAVNREPSLKNVFINLMNGNVSDAPIRSTDEIITMSNEVLEDIADSFIKENGEDAFPVSSETESKDVEFYGKKGVVVPSSYRTVLEKKFGNVSQLKENFKYAIIKFYRDEELSCVENNILNEAINDINLATWSLTRSLVEVCDFKDEKIDGLFCLEAHKIQIARKTLLSINETRMVLVRELARSTDEDEQAQCKIWAKMFETLKNNV